MNQKGNTVKIGSFKMKGTGLSLAVALSLLLGGCTLAKPELQQTGEDKLAGILVTVGEQEAQRRREEELEDRTFSSIKELEESLISSVTAEGTRQSDGTYVFEGVEGHMLGIAEEKEDGEAYVHFINDGSFTEVKADTSETDGGRKDRISGVVLAEDGLKEPVYMHPVYIREDGSCYVVLDGSGFLMGGVKTEGEVYGTTFQREASEEINGEKVTNSIEIEVSLKMAAPVEKLCIRMYNDRDELLREEEIRRGMEEISVQEETAYVIVEEKTANGNTKRSLYNWDEEQDAVTHQVNYPGEDGLLAPEDLILKK